MLAYVFWHSADPAIPIQEYVRRLHAFHETLHESPPAGLLASYTWRVEAVPWLDGLNSFEDWYLLEDASYLDALAEGAVSGSLRPAHDSVAHLAARGTAGLYKPARALQAQVDGPVVTWFSKPAGTSYDDLYASLNEQDPSISNSLWQRFLTLGPTPEFCVTGNEALDLPAGCASYVVERCR
jgi:hypothetical protein